MTAAKTFSVKRDGKSDLHFAAFPAVGNGRAFIDFEVGEIFGGRFSVIIYMADARSLLAALSDAINHADHADHADKVRTDRVEEAA